ncbi:hypothetical protein ACOMHN_029012 [Nucella lapillus]
MDAAETFRQLLGQTQVPQDGVTHPGTQPAAPARVMERRSSIPEIIASSCSAEQTTQGPVVYSEVYPEVYLVQWSVIRVYTAGVM